MMLRVVLVTQDDPFYLPFFFKSFNASLKKTHGIKVVGVIIQKPLGKKSFTTLVRELYDFYGFADFLRMGTRFVVKKFFDFCAVRICGGCFPGSFSVTHYLLKHKIPIIHNQNINEPVFVSRLRAMQLDLIVSAGASQKFKDAILRTPRLGCINIHNSMLPKGRGMYPTFWALLNHDKDRETAMSIFLMDEEWDAGPILVQEKVALEPMRSLDYLTKKLKIANGPLLVDLLKRYRDGEDVPRLPNDSNLATYHTFPKRIDVDAFRAKGLRLL